ncbi:vWA domain-containing protein [Chitinophaga japonensis]|uniref:von Willebrand factor type A domain-containing protein n=1 Tax=Chitinophaga japonensis TaxID=104662 RepID=A0A562T0G8_CHIJA|nr:vWA domain-containing protein [Chitinophaga japonensis]TWI87027.1 von Willebrand factor type A domain-containing protein [Chitinophaga japonensis]
MNTLKNIPQKIWLLTLSAVLGLLPMLVKAQDINIPGPNAVHVFNFTHNVSVGTINISLSPNTHSNVLWSFENLPAGRTDPVMENGEEIGFTINGIVVKLPNGATTGTAGSATAQISGTGDPTTMPGLPINFRIRIVTDSGGGTPAQRDYQINIQRKPLDLALVLDRSGSMAWSLDGADFSPPPGESRWELLQQGVSIMKNHLEVLAESDDQITVRMFGSYPTNNGVVVPGAPFNAGTLVPMDAANLAALNTGGSLWTGVSPLGNTPLGNGMLAGRDLLVPAMPNDHNKAMIVFSDGEQNAGNQQVKTTAPNAYTQTVLGEVLRSTPPNEIKIYTVNLGFSGIAPDMMAQIGANNGGSFLNNGISGTVTDINNYFMSMAFTTQITNILSGSSPQLVDFHSSVFPLAPAGHPVSEGSFHVNKGASSLIVTLMGPGRRYEPHFTSIKKDGQELIQYVKRTSDAGYISFSIKFPVPGLPNLSSEGEWVVRAALGANPGKSVPYALMAVVDDHGLKPVYSLGAQRFKVGQSMQPKVTLRHLGKTLDHAKVEVWIVKPGDDINDLVARSKTDFDQQPGDPGTPGAAKLSALMKDSSFVKRVMNQQSSIQLAYDKTADAYTATFNGLDVAGVYQAIFHISGKDTALGNIQRFHQESFYVRFPDIDIKSSNIVVSTSSSGNSVITFTPQTSKGRLIGSGWGSTITVDDTDATIERVVDKGDGSYEIHMKGTVKEPVKISVAGEPAYDAKLTSSQDCNDPDAGFLTRVKCWLISIGLPGWIIWLILAVLAGVLVLLGKRKKK